MTNKPNHDPASPNEAYTVLTWKLYLAAFLFSFILLALFFRNFGSNVSASDSYATYVLISFAVMFTASGFVNSVSQFKLWKSLTASAAIAVLSIAYIMLSAWSSFRSVSGVETVGNIAVHIIPFAAAVIVSVLLNRFDKTSKA